MKRITAWAVLAAFAAALLLALLPASPARATMYENFLPVDYNVRFTAGNSTVSVTMKYTSTGHGSFGGYFRQEVAVPDSYLDIVRITGADGSALAASWDAEDQAWEIDVPGEVTVEYVVDLNYLRDLKGRSDETEWPGDPAFSPGDPAFSPFMPHWDEGYFFMPGAFLFLSPIDLSGETDYNTFNVTFDLPEGWQAWPSWDPSGDTEHNTVSGAVFAGEALPVEIQGEIPLTVVQPLNADPANLSGQQELADKLSAQLQTANGAWGGPGIEGGRLLVFLGAVTADTVDNRELLSIPHYPLYGCAFVPVGERENILSLDLLERGSEGQLRVLLGGLSVDPEARWFLEGCIHYSSLVFSQADSWMDANDVYDRLGADYALYVDALTRSGTSLAEAGMNTLKEAAQELLYSGGTIAVTSIDASLAEKGMRLNDLVASLFADDSYAILSNRELEGRLGALSGEDFSSFFDDYITGTAVIPASAFSQLKLDGNTSSGDSGNSSSTATGTDIAPAPAFGNGWILMLVAVLLVFAVPFLMEPFALRPRGGAVAVSEEELEAERLARKKAYWGEHYGEDKAAKDAGGGEGAGSTAAEPEGGSSEEEGP